MLDEATGIALDARDTSQRVLERRQRAHRAEERDARAPRHRRQVQPGETRPAQRGAAPEHDERDERCVEQQYRVREQPVDHVHL
jgi:hypothetical protein